MWRAAMLLCLCLPGLGLAADFRTFVGHGGPVVGVVVSEDGQSLLTASFDYSIGYWRLSDASEPLWLEGHRAAVNTVNFLSDSSAVSGSDDFSLIIWDLKDGSVTRRLEGHKGKVTAVRPSPGGDMIASASWDGTIHLWDLTSGNQIAVLQSPDGGFNDVLWLDSGHSVATASVGGTLIEWDVQSQRPMRVLARHGFGINRLEADESEGWLAYGAVDGGTRVLNLADGAELADLTLDRRPILAIAKSADGSLLAVGDGEGYVMVVSTEDWSILRDFHAAVNGPIWALDFTASGDGIFAAGISDAVSLWPMESGDLDPLTAETERSFHVDPSTVSNGERQFLRKCSVCHTLGAAGERRAGPALAGLFGRRSGSLDGYSYSDALRELDIVWSEDTIDKLFELGPDHFTPGSKMPMQRITSAEDRADLVEFLRLKTAAGE